MGSVDFRAFYPCRRFKKKEKPAGIYELLGYAVGCIGMSRDDFCACYLDEFEAIAKAWRERQEIKSQELWEQCRMLATISIQPHVKRRITPKQLLPFPWDRKASEAKRSAEDKLTPEERLQRFEKLVAKAI